MVRATRRGHEDGRRRAAASVAIASLAALPAHAAAIDLDALQASLTTLDGVLQLGTIALCMLLAWVLVRLWRGTEAEADSIWFGARIVDGALFPVLAWLALLGAGWLLERYMRTPILDLAVPLLLSLAVLRGTVRVLRQAFPNSRYVRIAERTFSWLVWFAAVLWLTGLLPRLLQAMDELRWHMGGTDVSLRSLLEGGLSVLVVLLGMLWLSALIERRLLQGAVDNISVRKIAANATRAVLLLVGLLVALSAAGIPLGALGVLSGAVGVGIGFGLQKLASNYVSGFVILAERSLRIGDMVKVDNFEGRVTDIKTRYTVIRALNGRESIVPNELLVTSRVENASFADRKVLVNSTVQVDYGTDIDALLPQLAACIAGVPRVLADPAPVVLLADFAADGLQLTMSFWIDDPENGQGNVRSAVNLAVLQLLRALGVRIPYPQREVRYLDASGAPGGGVASSASPASTASGPPAG